MRRRCYGSIDVGHLAAVLIAVSGSVKRRVSHTSAAGLLISYTMAVFYDRTEKPR
jgi:hypothetical protein